MKNYILISIFFITSILKIFSQSYTVPKSGSTEITTCNGIVSDDGGVNADYSNNANGILIINSAVTNGKIKLNFKNFSFNSTSDILSIYDGNSISAPLIGSYNSQKYPLDNVIMASNISGALTLKLTSDQTYTSYGFSAEISCSTIEPKPDLLIKSISLTSTTLNLNTKQYINYDIENQGDKSVNSFNIGIYLSTDANWDSKDSVLAIYQNNYTISGNSKQSDYSTFTLPSNLKGNNFYILVKADMDNIIVENDELNNINTIKINIPKSKEIDFSIKTYDNNFNSVCQGKSILISNTIKNQGNINSISNSINYYLSTNPLLDSTDVFLKSTTTSPIPFANSISINDSILIPQNTSPGNYYIISFVDPLNSIAEVYEENNSSLTRVKILSKEIDIELLSIGLSYTKIPVNTTINLQYSILKNSFQNISTKISTYLSLDSIVDSHDTLLNNTDILLTNAYPTTSSIKITIPSLSTYGNYYLISIIDQANLINEIIETNNTITSPIIIQEDINDLLIVSSKIDNSYVYPTKAIYYSSSIRNIGNCSINSNLGLYLSKDTILDSSDLNVSNVNGILLNTISDYSFSTTFSVPLNTQLGNYYILSYIDNLNINSETNEKNNISINSIIIDSPTIDILPLDLKSPVTAIFGTQCSISYNVINSGTISTSNFMDVYYISSDTILDSNDLIINYPTSHFTLGSNEKTSSSSSFYIPGNTMIGNNYLLVFVDYKDTNHEVNEKNNIIWAPIQILPYSIDLKMTDIVSSKSVDNGGSMYISCKIKNEGNKISSTSNIGVYLSTDTLVSNDDILLKFSNGGILKSQEFYTFSSVLTFSKNIPNGNYYLLFDADYTKTILESNENNNIVYSPFIISDPFIDLTIEKVTLPINAITENSFNLNSYIKNNGTLTANNVNINYYLSKDSILSQNDTLLNSSTILNIAFNQIIQSTLTLNLPSNIVTGQYYIITSVDYTNTIIEKNEMNNLFISSIYLTNNNDPSFLVPQSGNSSITTCGGMVYDNGGYKSNYLNNSSGFLTIHPGNINSYISLDFSDFNIDTTNDALYIYDGVSTAANLLGVYKTSPGKIYATNPKGAITLLFISNSSVTNTGFAALINCNNSVSLPDLIISSPTVSSTKVIQGNSITASCLISNKGTSYSTSSNIGYYISKDTLWDLNDLILTNYSGGIINQTFTNTINSTLTIPNNHPIGKYYILFYADYSSISNENNENNNIGWTQIYVNPFITDLRVDTASLQTLSAKPGSNISLNVKIFNPGSSPMSNIYMGYYLSTDSIWNSTDLSIGGDFSFLMLPNSSQILSRTAMLPITVLPGKYYIIFYGDNPNYIIENDESNNMYHLPFTVIPFENDISITNPTIFSGGIVPGNSVSVNNTIYYTGTSDLNFIDVIYYLSRDSILDNNDISIYTTTLTTINFNKNNLITSSLPIPTNTLLGKYYIICNVDSQNKVIESNKLNNVSFNSVNVITTFNELKISALFSGSPIIPIGTNSRMDAIISNSGNSTINLSGLQTGVYLSIDSLIDSSDKYIGDLYYNCSFFTSNTSCLSYINFNISQSIQPGDYYFIFNIDQTNTIVEKNENNNISYSKVKLQSPFVDLLVVNPSLNVNSIVSSNYVTLDFTVLNSGNIGITTYENCKFLLSTDTIFDPNDILLSSSQTSSIPANYFNKSTVNLTIPSDTKNGLFYILIYNDPDFIVPEINESNNITYIKINVIAPSIDLNISNAKLNISEITSGSTIKCYNTIYNQGNSLSNYCQTNYYLSKDPYYSSNDIELFNESINNVAESSFYNQNVLLTIPSITLSGNYYILVYTDFNNKNTETNENNNVYSIPLNIFSYLSDLVIKSNSVNSAQYVPIGSFFSVNCAVKNQGNASSYLNNLGFYLSQDATYNPGDILLQNYPISIINKGDSVNITSSLMISPNTTSGPYYIVFYIDNLQTETESNENNNTAYSTITLVPNLVDYEIINIDVKPNVINSGSYLNLFCTVINTGPLTSQTSKVGYYLSQDSKWDINDKLLSFSTVNPMAKNETNVLSSYPTIPLNTPNGKYYILFFADYLNSEMEVNENNNIVSQQITINSMTNLSTISDNTTISILPNPTKDYLTILNSEIHIDRIEFLDITGKILFEENYQNKLNVDSQMMFDLSRFSQGNYILKIYTENKIDTRSIVIQY